MNREKIIKKIENLFESNVDGSIIYKLLLSSEFETNI